MSASKVQFDYKVINLAVEKEVEKVTLPIARKIATAKFNESLETFLEEIEDDPVSQELLEENDIDHSNFISGASAEEHGANLYSFLGFVSGEENPVKVLLNLIRKNFKLSLRTKLIDNNYTFNVTFPTEAEIKKTSPLEWTTRSWITSIEKGISNAIYYLRKEGHGRSEGGVQSKGKNDKKFKPEPGYFSAKYRLFIKSIKE